MTTVWVVMIPFLPLSGTARMIISAPDFAKEVAPILEAKCLGCHNPNLLKGDFSMSTREDILAGGEDYLIPGDADESMLYWITQPFQPGEPPEMPKEGDPLTEIEGEILARWIDAGAVWPEGLVLKEASKAGKSWWAYQPIEEPERDSIDAYVEAKLSEYGLNMNPEADRRSLIRRATYDLTGLPPGPEEVKAFVNDPDPLAYKKLIDRLLASPHYGERWGRHWLDVVRFGESVGFEQNWIINDLWPFRDYVIRSINDDKPFDLLIREHIAGDVFGSGNPEVEIGSACLVAGPYDSVNNQDEDQKAQIRANTIDEMINATGGAFLGMTLSCARCHDHKFDPISQQDYYQLHATFAGVRHGAVPWATEEAKRQRAALLEPLNRKKAALEKKLEELNDKVFERSKARLGEYATHWVRPPTNRTGTEDTFPPVTAKMVRLVCESQDLHLGSKVGWRIDEFEVWSAGNNPRNVALARNGAVASGKARAIEDFPGAYGTRHVNDGKIDHRFIAAGDTLTITLAEPTEIDRVFFSSAQAERVPDLFKFAFVAEYRIETSLDGKTWKEVAHGRDRQPVERKPFNPARPDPPDEPTHLQYRLMKLGMTGEEAGRKRQLQKDLKSINEQIKSVPALPVAWMGLRNEEDAAGPFHVFLGGSPQRRGSEVAPASLSILSEVVPGYRLPANSGEAQRRVHLAEWITHPANPLTPRVLANRLWHYHFGSGIVDTPNDFGYMGGRPTHPELLDFLAHRLVKNHWRLKAVHKMIMTSRVYRQSTDWKRDAADQDGNNRLLWRFPPRRLSAEEIRDTLLSISGMLDTTMGGPGYRLYHFMRDNVSTYRPLDTHGPETYRRAVYHQNARASVVDLMTDFDQADCTLSTPRRVNTTTPLQALTLLNHSFTIDMSKALSERAEGAGGDVANRIERIFELAYQRPPDMVELEQCKRLVQIHGLPALCRAIINSNELLYLN